MFHQFLNSCRSVLEEKAISFDAVRSKFRTADDLFIGYMPNQRVKNTTRAKLPKFNCILSP